MSVIIRLQNLPWSANALDIRQFFKGLSIPEGGVHIVGGEMGDAFIAFSTDEDARQGMMRDREAINGVQVRLLLSSRAEMQKVIEIARQQSLLALKKANLIPTAKATPPKVIVPKPMVQAPQPPVISASSFQNILSNPLSATPSFLAYQQQAGITLIPDPNSTASSTKNNRNDSDDSETRRERRRSDSRERRRSRTRSRERNSMPIRRRERSRERSRDRDWQSGRRSSRRSRSREKSRALSRDHSRDRSRERNRERSRSRRDSSRRNSRDTTSRSRNIEVDIKTKPLAVSSWNITNAYQANYNSLDSTSKSSNTANSQQTNKISGYEVNYNSLDSAPKNNNQFNKFAGQMGTNSNSMVTTGNLTNSLSSPVAAATISVTAVATTFQNYNTTNPSLTSLNNYSLSSLLSASTSTNSFKGFALQNPYTTALHTKNNQGESSANVTATTTTTSTSAIPGIFVEKKSDAITVMQTSNTESVVVNALPQEPIAFSTVNPYEQMYPKLFAQAAALGSVQKPTAPSAKQSLHSLPNSSPKRGDYDEIKSREVDPNETSCVKISNMCSRTTYSDLRKFFVGLFIPHNGIKMLNDKHGLRVGIAYVQFSRQSSVAKALCRTNNLLKGKSVIIDAVAEEEFEEAEDSFRPNNQDKLYHGARENDSDRENNENSENSGYSALNPFKKIITTEPFSVLYIEDIPALATEQDIIKMFSSYSLYDILLLSSPENRREFVAHARFSREEDAKSAYEDKAHHQIGYRRLRVRPGTIEDMDNAKEKIRLANEQLMKEEQAAKVAAEEEEEAKRKLEKLITEQITIEEEKEKQQQQQHIVSLDLTQDEDVEEDNDDVVETTNELENDKETENYDIEEDIEEDNDYEDDGNGNDNNDNDAEQLPSNDNLSYQGNNNMNNNFNKDPRRLEPNTKNNNNSNIPSLFDINPMNSNPNSTATIRTPAFNDPRLRNGNARAGVVGISGPNNNNNNNNNNNMMMMEANNFNNFNPNFNSQQQTNPPVVNSIERNFVILKNCDYNTRINDVAQLLITANLGLKHIEPLRNERQLPTGEFIVEFRRTQDAETAIQHFHNIQYRNRSLRVFPISPQEIADRLNKPFLGYIPGGNGIRITNSGGGGGVNIMPRNNFIKPNSNINSLMNNSRFGINTQQQQQRIGGIGNINSFRGTGDNIMPPSNLNRVGIGNMGNNMKLNDMPPNNMNDDNNNDNNISDGGGIPEKFQRPGCVISLENVPYKAQLSDILRFFQGYGLIADDIIRRFNDDGSPTGDARVAFNTPDQAQAAFEAKKRKQIFGRTIFLNIM